MILPQESLPDTPPRFWKSFRRGDLIAVFALALFLRLALLAVSNAQGGIQHVSENCFDCNLYLSMARSIAGGGGDTENGFFYFGPGFAYLLAIPVYLFKGKAALVIIVSVIVSSLSCLLIYLLAMMLTRSYPVAITAAVLSAVSYTSICLSCLLLSDTFYFFIFLAGLLVYLKALHSGRWIFFILAGLMAGAAALTRPVAQYWPVVMILIAVIYLWRRSPSSVHYRPRPRKTVIRVAVAVGIAVVIILGWMARNNRVHGVFTMAITSANGPANLAAVTIERRDGTYSKEVMQGWIDDYSRRTGNEQVSLGELFILYRTHARSVIDSLPWDVARTYLSLVWANLNQISLYHRLLVPEFNGVTIPLEHLLERFRLNYLCFVASILGTVILVWKRQYRAAAVLGIIYLYYVSSIGFFRWQGSRYFFPGQTAWAVLVAVVLVFLGNAARRGLRQLAVRLGLSVRS